MLLAGVLADKLFEPAMHAGGSLTPIFGQVVGTGDGAGIGLMFVLAGLAELVLISSMFSLTVIQNIEDIIPDYDVLHTEQVVKT